MCWLEVPLSFEIQMLAVSELDTFSGVCIELVSGGGPEMNGLIIHLWSTYKENQRKKRCEQFLLAVTVQNLIPTKPTEIPSYLKPHQKKIGCTNEVVILVLADGAPAAHVCLPWRKALFA